MFVLFMRYVVYANLDWVMKTWIVTYLGLRPGIYGCMANDGHDAVSIGVGVREGERTFVANAAENRITPTQTFGVTERRDYSGVSVALRKIINGPSREMR